MIAVVLKISHFPALRGKALIRSSRAQARVLSQILGCRRCEAYFPLLVWLLRGQGVELFSRTAALLTAPCKLPCAQHVHQLNAGDGGLRGSATQVMLPLSPNCNGK